MFVPKASVQRTARLTNRTLKATRNSFRTRYVQRRAYASGGDHSHQKAGGDLPWAITSISITLPCVWYLLPPSKKSHEHEHEHEDGNEKNKGHTEDDKASEDKSIESTESSIGTGDDRTDKENGDEKSNESDSQEEGQQDTPDTTDDESEKAPHEKESGAEVEGVRFKGAVKGTEGGQGDTRKHIPDAKGSNNLRIESDYGKRQGVAQDGATVQESGNVQDKGAASKTPGSMGVQSGKQEGISNADTKHSTDIANDPEKSSKPGGDPETSKSKGTIDPNPQH